MSSFMIFDDTGLGVGLAKALREANQEVCIGADYPPPEGEDISYVKLPEDENQLRSMMENLRLRCVIDSLSRASGEWRSALQKACSANRLSYYRLVGERRQEHLYAEHMKQACEVLAATTGNILVMLPVEQLEEMTEAQLMNRCYVVTEPRPGRLSQCHSMGVPWKQMICIAPPYRRNLIASLLQMTNAAVLLADAADSVALGAAGDGGVTAIALGAPQVPAENVLTPKEMGKLLTEEYGVVFAPAGTAEPMPVYFRGNLLRVLVFGGDGATGELIKQLYVSGAQITVVCASLSEEWMQQPIRYIERGYQKGDCKHCDLVVAMTGNPIIDEAVAVEARTKKLPVYRHSAPEHSDFILPEILRREGCTCAFYDPEQSKKRMSAFRKLF